MKVCLSAGGMNLDRKDERKHVEIQKFIYLGNRTVKTFFLVLMFYNHMGYLPSIMF